MTSHTFEKRRCGFEYDVFARCIKFHASFDECKELFKWLDACMMRLQ